MAQQTHPQHGDASLSEAQQSTYDSLIGMGFSSGKCTEVAQVFGANLQGAINHLLQSSTAPPLDNPMPPIEKIPSMSFEFAPPPELVRTFCITKLTKLLTFGYIRMSLEPDEHIPKGIQLEIVKYVNLLLVRLNYNLHGDIVSNDGDNPITLPVISMDCDTKLNILAKCLERDGPIKYNYDDIGSWESEYVPQFVRIWMRFKNVCEIYPLKGSRYTDDVTMEDIMAIEEDPSRWVEVPDDYTKTFIWEINDIPEDDEPQEIALEFYDQINRVWPSRTNHGINHEELPLEVNEESDAKETTHEWRNQLKVGDFVDAKDDQEKWYESVVRYIDRPEDDKKLVIHFIGWNIKWDEKISAMNEDKIQKRGTHSRGPHRPRPKRRYRLNRY